MTKTTKIAGAIGGILIIAAAILFMVGGKPPAEQAQARGFVAH